MVKVFKEGNALRVIVSPEVLKWAINVAGGLEKVKKRFQDIDKWGKEKYPTIKQLHDFSKYALIPFGILLLEKPPTEKKELTFFRRKRKEKSESEELSPELRAIIRLIKRKQDFISEYYQELGYEKNDLVGSLTTDLDIEKAADFIRKSLGLEKSWILNLHKKDDVINFLREKLVDKRIFVFLSSYVGNNTRRTLNPEEFSGFVLLDDYTPVIFINSKDFLSSQIFTLAHEIVHVFIGREGIFERYIENMFENEEEIFCNNVAGELLVPAEILKKYWEKEKDFINLGKIFKVSPLTVATRALKINLISEKEYKEFKETYSMDLERLFGESDDERYKEKKRGGEYKNIQLKRWGRFFIKDVFSAFQEGFISHIEVKKLTGLTLEQINEILITKS